jgi:hypothetical protein
MMSNHNYLVRSRVFNQLTPTPELEAKIAELQGQYMQCNFFVVLTVLDTAQIKAGSGVPNTAAVPTGGTQHPQNEGDSLNREVDLSALLQMVPPSSLLPGMHLL